MQGLAPVENGLGAYVKYKISQLQEDWLENDSNMDKWEANLLTASERRVLIVKWAAIAVEAAYSRREMLWKYFEGAGALMTADGTCDDKIKLEGWDKADTYEFMHVDLQREEDDDDDAAFLEPPVPDDDEEDEEREEACVLAGDLDYEDVPDTPDFPEGATPLAECPDINKLKKSTVLFKWDCGWSEGTVANKIRSKDYNYFIRYVDVDGKMEEYRHGLTAANYWCDSNIDGVWVVIERADDDE